MTTKQPNTLELVKQSPYSHGNVQHGSKRIKKKNKFSPACILQTSARSHGVQTGSMYQLERAQGTLKVGPSIPPLSTSTLISSLLIQKAVRAPSSPAMKTPQPENIPLKKEAPLVKYESTPADCRYLSVQGPSTEHSSFPRKM